MNKKLDELYQYLKEQQAKGAPAAKLDAAVKAATGGHMDSFSALEVAVESSHATAASDASAIHPRTVPSDKGFFAGLSTAPRIAADWASGGLLDEAGGLVRGAGAALAHILPGGETPGHAFHRGYDAEVNASRQRLAQAKQAAGPGTELAAGAVGILGPALLAGGAGATGMAGRIGSPFLRGAAAGAAEGAAFGAGSADPSTSLSIGQSLKERAKAARLPAAAGAVTGGILGTIGAGMSARSAEEGAGRRLGQTARNEAPDLSAKPSKVEEDIAAKKSRISAEKFKPLERLGKIESPGLRKALQSEDVKPIVEKLFPKIASGEEAPTFLQLQKIRKRLAGLRDKAVRSGDSYDLEIYGKAERELTDAMGSAVDGFPEAQAAWAEQMGRSRALEKGRKLMNSGTADDFEQAFEALKTEAEKKAFREGALAEWVARLEKLSQPKAILRQIRESPQIRDRLRIVFGGEENLNRFAKMAAKEDRIRSRSHLYDRLLKFIIPIAASTIAGEKAVKATHILGM